MFKCVSKCLLTMLSLPMAVLLEIRLKCLITKFGKLSVKQTNAHHQYHFLHMFDALIHYIKFSKYAIFFAPA
jgi:hypothetical protein